MARIAVIALTNYESDPRVRRESRALQAAGHDVTIYAMRKEGEPRRRTINGKTLIGLVPRRYRGDGRFRYIFGYLAFFFRAAVAVSRDHLRGPRFEMVQVHSMPDFLVFSALIPRLTGARVVLDLHELMPELYASKFGRRQRWAWRLLMAVERASASFAHHVLAVSEPHLERLLANHVPEDSISVIHNSPDPAVFPRGEALLHRGEVERFAMVYHGTVARRHGLETAIRAFAMAVDERPDLHFRILGDGDDADRITALIQSLGLTSAIDFQRGMRPLEEVVPDIVGCSLGVVPMLADDVTEMMLPTKLLEYMQLGLPTVCSATRTVVHYFGNGETRLVPAGDIDALAAAILELSSDMTRIDSLVQRGFSRVEALGWEQQRTRYLGVVSSLLDGAKSAR